VLFQVCTGILKLFLNANRFIVFESKYTREYEEIK